MELTWADRSPAELTLPVLHDILALRNRVFVVEQDCAYQDIDGLDLADGTRHVLAVGQDGIVAYARVLPPASHGQARIGRVIVSPEVRGQRLGRQLMATALASCATHWPAADVRVSAQAHLREFYASLGFVAEGEAYDEDGIPHLDMVRPRA